MYELAVYGTDGAFLYSEAHEWPSGVMDSLTVKLRTEVETKQSECFRYVIVHDPDLTPETIAERQEMLASMSPEYPEKVQISPSEVRYSRLISGPDYSNEEIGVTVPLAAGADPAVAVAHARGFVRRMHRAEGDHRSLRDDVYSLRSEKQRLERDLATLRTRFERAKAFVEGLGISTADLRGFKASDLDDVPF